MKNKIILLLLPVFFGLVIFSSCKKEHSCEGCINGNKPPIAVAGTDQLIYLPNDSVFLDGTASSDPDGSISSFFWTKISGPVSFNINNAAIARTVVKNLIVGVYQFELKVKDTKGLSANDTIQITVFDPSQPNRPPVANAGADQVINLPVSSANLDGSGSTDPDNNITSYWWTKISGPALFNVANAYAVQTQVTNLVIGVYQFELKVTDARGLFSKDTLKIIVQDTPNCNLPPSYEIIVTLPIDSVFIDDYFRDTEGTCVVYLCGPPAGTIQGGWIKDLVPGVYLFRRYWINCSQPAEIIKITVLSDPSETNTITYKNLVWEYNCAWTTSTINCRHLFLAKPMWPSLVNYPIEVHLQMDSVNNGQWFPVPSNTDGHDFWLFCGFASSCLYHFVVKVSPENSSWDGRKANLKIKIL